MSDPISSSSSPSITSTGGNLLRITGMASGLDVDGMVQKMMAAENTKLDKLKQDQQKVQWQQDAYRSIIGSVNTFSSTYFDVLKSDTFMLSSRNYSAFDASSSDTNTATATAGVGAAAGNYNLVIDRVADSAKISGSTLSSQIQVTDISKWAGKSLSFNINNANYTINLDNSTTLDGLASEINKEITNNANLNGKISASAVTIGSSSYIKFNALTSDTTSLATNTTVGDINLTSPMQLRNATSSTTLSSLGIGSTSTQTLQLSYNGGTPTTITVDNSSGTETVSDLMKAISSATNGQVNASFDDLTSKFTLSTNNTGSGALLSITGGTMVSALGLTAGASDQGQDAKVTITPPGGVATTVTESKNIFTLNGITYNLTKPTNTTTFSGVNTGVTSLTTSSESLNGYYLVKQYNAGSNSPVTSSNGAGTGNAAGTGTVAGTLNGHINTSFNALINADGSITVKSSTDGGNTWNSFTPKSVDTSNPANINIDLGNGLKFNIASGAIGDSYNFSSTVASATLKLNSAADGSGTTIGNPTTVYNDQTSAVVGDPNTNNTAAVNFNFSSLMDDGTPKGDKITQSISSVNISVTSNTQKVFDKIKAFVDKYNDMISNIQSQITQKKDYNYQPLTDTQKKQMTTDQITAWETKAKAGIVQNDSMLQGMLYSMRSAFFDKVSSAGLSLSDVGMSTSSDYTEGGKIIIDETKLKNAIQNNGSQVAELFTNSSTINYNADHKNTSGDGRPYSARYDEEGIFQRINDAVKDYTRLTRDNNGNKGMLIQVAGVQNDASEFNNQLSDEINKDYAKRISDLTKQLQTKQDNYYNQFSKLETALTQLNSQSGWISSMMGSGA